MVKLHVKKGDESQFLYETTVACPVDDLVKEVAAIYNGRLKISRICSEMEELVQYGTMFPPEILGLLEEQVAELKLVDDWGEKCIPSGGWTFNKDPIGRRNGKQPNEKMQEIIKRAIAEAKAIASKKKVETDDCLKLRQIQEALDILRGTVMIVYPMGLPPHDPIREELENYEDLAGTQASLEVIEAAEAQLWFSGRELLSGKKLGDYAGKNEKTKAIVKIQKRGQGAPGREPVMSEAERKQMMMHAYRRQEEMKQLDQDDNDKYLDSEWADRSSLKRAFQGLSNISYRPK